MRNENGKLEMDPNAVREIATKFYVILLSKEPLSEDIRQNRMKVWAEIQPKVTQAMQDSLLSPITEMELEQALHSLSDNSCLGVDGLTPKFYRKYWGILKKDLRDAYQHICSKVERYPCRYLRGLFILYLKLRGFRKIFVSGDQSPS